MRGKLKKKQKKIEKSQGDEVIDIKVENILLKVRA